MRFAGSPMPTATASIRSVTAAKKLVRRFSESDSKSHWAHGDWQLHAIKAIRAVSLDASVPAEQSQKSLLELRESIDAHLQNLAPFLAR
jgi:hypothetical protein